MAAQRDGARSSCSAWRTSAAMDRFKALRRMFNDGGVTDLRVEGAGTRTMSDEEFEYVFDVAEALGYTHTTLELVRPDANAA